MVYDILRASVDGANIRLIDTIRGAERGTDALEATFVDGPPGQPYDLLYWIERVPRADGPNHFRIRFQLYYNELPALVDPGVLTIANGRPYTWAWQDVFIGEYMGGASYVGPQNTLHFVAAWVQNGALFINTIALGSEARKRPRAGQELATGVLSGAPPWPR